MGSFEFFYSSSLQQPYLLWFGTLAVLIFFLFSFSNDSRDWIKSSFGKFLLFWTLISLLDSWLTANSVAGFPTLPSAYYRFVPILFVLLGDFRVFYAVHLICKTQNFRLMDRTILFSALLWSLPVPLVSFAIAKACIPSGVASETSSRIVFLTYEVLFLVWISLFKKRISVTFTDPSPQSTWVNSIIRFSFFYYSLWALADLWILIQNPGQGRDLGFLMRCIPNLLYYAGWTPWVVWGYIKYISIPSLRKGSLHGECFERSPIF